MEATKENIFKLITGYMNSRKQTFVPGTSRVSVGWPSYGPEEIINATDSLLDLRITQGEKVGLFEREYAAYVGTVHGVAVNSGSSANLLAINALIAAGRVAPGAEVIAPSATFTTVISPIIQNGLVPVFVDVDPTTYNICPAAIEAAITKETGLLMPVHSLGCPADMPAIMRIAQQHDLPVLEDCCEAHSATIDGKMVGSFGLLGTYSFFVAHNMTTGEGGMVMTNDPLLDRILRSMREFGRLRDVDSTKPRFHFSDEMLDEYDERYVFERMGYNVRMTDICAAFGIEQLRRLDMLNARRTENVTHYLAHLAQHERHLQLPTIPKGYFHSFYSFPLLVRDGAPFRRNDLVRFLEDHNIETRAFMGGNLAVQPAYRHERTRTAGSLAVTEKIMKDAFFIGCHPQIDAAQRTYVLDTFDTFFKERT